MVRKITFGAVIFTALAVLFCATCEEAQQDDQGKSSCGGYITAIATGAVNQNICCDVFDNYAYQENATLNLFCSQDGTIVYSISINMDSGRGPFNGEGTYECGIDESGFVTFYIYDDEGTLLEAYKSISGTITISKADEFNFSAEFDVVMVDWDDEITTVNLSGEVVK